MAADSSTIAAKERRRHQRIKVRVAIEILWAVAVTIV